MKKYIFTFIFFVALARVIAFGTFPSGNPGMEMGEDLLLTQIGDYAAWIALDHTTMSYWIIIFDSVITQFSIGAGDYTTNGNLKSQAATIHYTETNEFSSMSVVDAKADTDGVLTTDENPELQYFSYDGGLGYAIAQG